MKFYCYFLFLFALVLAQELPPDYKVLDVADLDKVKGNAEVYQYETEVSRLMNIIINSIYKSKDIFLRELISNASDALDKIRFLSLTDKHELDSNPDLKITVFADHASGTLTIRDTGIGMDKKTLKENLGTIAKSGTAEFMKVMQTNNSDLIGQFGVGFYSAFLVADRVTVVSKHNSDEQYIWESKSNDDFTLVKDPRGNTLGRGTEIILHIKEDQKEFLKESVIKSLIQKHSEFINFPIYVWSVKEVEEKVPIEEDNSPVEDDVEDVNDDDKLEEKYNVVTKKVAEWELINENKPIWTRPPNQITKDEYHSFYKSFFKDIRDPLAYSHFRGEGDVDFKAIIYIPEEDLYQPESAKKNEKNVKIFVRKVFITDELSDFLPKWLNFVKVLIDADDLPLSVSRETLQKHHSLKTIEKKVIGKALDLLLSLSKDEDSTLFDKIWASYHPALKYGVYEAKGSNLKKLIKLLRYHSSHSKDTKTSLEQYVDRMKEKQPQIYFVATNTLSEAEKSPLVEKLVARGYEVLAVDEYLVQMSLKEFEGIPLQNVGKSGVKFGDEEALEEENKKLNEKFQPLINWLSTALSEKVSEVVISSHLTTSFAAVLPSKMGISAAQEKIYTIQYAGRKEDPMLAFYKSQKRILEINPHHPLIEAISNNMKHSEIIPDVLFEAAALASGWEPRNPTQIASSIDKLVRLVLGADLEKEAKVTVERAQERKEKPKREEKLDEHDEL